MFPPECACLNMYNGTICDEIQGYNIYCPNYVNCEDEHAPIDTPNVPIDTPNAPIDTPNAKVVKVEEVDFYNVTCVQVTCEFHIQKQEM